MPAELRPRLHGPPEDHNYSHRRTGDQVYNEHNMPYVIQGIECPAILTSVTKPDFSSDDESSECQVVTKKKDDSIQAPTESKQPEPLTKGPPQIRKRKRRHSACYDFGIPKRRKKPKKAPDLRPADEPWNLLTSTASLASQHQTVCSTDLTPDDIHLQPTENHDASVDNVSPVKCKSCCASWHGFRARTHKKNKSCGSEPHRQSQRLVIKNYKLPFEDLPTECKLHIFQLLSPKERGMAARVCSEWYNLMSCSSLWSDLDFSDFDFTALPILPVFKGNNSNTSLRQPLAPSYSKYVAYKERMAQFLAFLETVEPSLQRLQFSFDIGHPKDDWLKYILTLLKQSKCHGLRHLSFNWMNTPMRPPVETFCCIYNKIRTLYRRHHNRSVALHELMGHITRRSPNVEALSMPFDWRPRSVLLLSRLHGLRHLHLGQYLTLQGMTQELLDVVLKNLPCLTHLELQVCVPLYSSKVTYKISHLGLQTIDLAHSKGLFLREVNLPQLHVIRIFQHSWRGPLVDNPELRPGCLYDILKRGAPNLVLLNKHRLFGYWQEYLYEELGAHLYRACPCQVHTTMPTTSAMALR